MKKYILLLIGIFVLSGCTILDENSLTIYTTRHYEVDRQIFESFEKETGVKLNVVELRGEELISRLKTEGSNSPVDIVLMAGAEYIYTLDTEMQTLIPLNLPEITNSLESEYYGDNWYAFSKRTRDVFVANDASYSITSYLDLSDQKFNDEILVRSSSSLYNQAWIAAMVQVYGQVETEAFLEGFVSNFSKKPDGGDRDQIRSILSNEGNIAIANGYYLNGMLNSNDEAEINAANNVSFANLDLVFENISFAAKLKNNPDADDFLIYLNNNQGLIASENGEIPTDKNVEFTNHVSNRTLYQAMEIDFATLGKYLSQAYDLMISNGWD